MASQCLCVLWVTFISERLFSFAVLTLPTFPWGQRCLLGAIPGPPADHHLQSFGQIPSCLDFSTWAVPPVLAWPRRLCPSKLHEWSSRRGLTTCEDEGHHVGSFSSPRWMSQHSRRVKANLSNRPGKGCVVIKTVGSDEKSFMNSVSPAEMLQKSCGQTEGWGRSSAGVHGASGLMDGWAHRQKQRQHKDLGWYMTTLVSVCQSGPPLGTSVAVTLFDWCK